jgi:hypothetical protein
VSFPDLQLVPDLLKNAGDCLPYSAEATGVPDNGPNTIGLPFVEGGVEPDLLLEGRLLIFVCPDPSRPAGGSAHPGVTDCRFVSLSPDKTEIVLDFAQSGTGDAHVCVQLLHTTEGVGCTEPIVLISAPEGGSSPPASGLSTRMIGSTKLASAGESWPTIMGSMIGNSAVGNYDVVEQLNASHYNYCQKRLAWGSTRVPITATSQAELLAALNANGPNDGANFTESVFLETYDLVSGDVTPPTKLYGRNGVLARIKSRISSYHSKAQKVVSDNGWSSVGGDAMLRQIWLDMFGQDLAPLNDLKRSLFWLTINPNHRYDQGSPQAGHFVELSGGPRGRRGTPLGSVAPVDASADGWYSTGETLFATINGQSGAAGGTAPWSHWSKQGYQYLLTRASVIVAVELRNGAGTHRSVLLKPYGQDTFSTNYFDPATHRLECVTSSNRSQNNRIRALTPGLPGTPYIDTSGPFYLGDMLRASAAIHSVRGKTYGPGDIQVYLRDLTTGYVSAFTPTVITWVRNRASAPLMPVVVNRPSG